MDTKKLRQKILDLAIHGKLVPQDPNDEPANVLLERIRAEKEALIKEGKIKRAKKSTASTDTSHYENVPFEVPEGWCWCTLDDLAFYKKGPFGSSLTKSMFVPDTPSAYKVYEQKNAIQKDHTLGSYFIDENKYQELKGFSVEPFDIIVSCAGTIGETYVVPKDIRAGIINQALMLIRLHLNDIQDFYLLYFDFILKAEAAKESKGTAIKNIPPFDVLKSFLIPLPPLAEQGRILEEVNRLMSFVDSIDEGTKDISSLMSSAKSKVLELAIHGKLVSQDPADEPASELLKRINTKAIISCDNPHYTDLPRGWVMLKGKELFKPMKSTKPSGETFKYIDIDSINNKIGVVTAPKILKSSDAPSRATRFTVKGDIVFSMVRPYLRNIAIVPENGCIASTGFYVCSPNGVMSSDYCYYLMTSNYVVEGLNKYMKGDNSPSINNNHINEWLFPVPPLKEQARIVSKLQDILSQLDSIMSSLQA